MNMNSLNSNCKHEHTIETTVCKWCGEETTELSSGTEGWTYCEGCQMIEPDTQEAEYCTDCDELIYPNDE